MPRSVPKPAPGKIRLIDVARAVGVSVPTVSDVLNRQERCFASPQTKQRIFQTAKQLGYRPNIVARNLRKQTTHSWGLIFPSFNNDYTNRLIQAVHEAASDAGYHVVFEPHRAKSGRTQQEALDNLVQRMVEGVFIFWHHSAWEFETEMPLPVVLIDTVAHQKAPAGADRILVERVAPVREATGHLLQQGRRRVGLVVGVVEDEVTRAKIQGWREAYQLAGVRADESLILRRLPEVFPEQEWDTAQGELLAQQVLRGELKLDGALVDDGFAAIGFMRALLAGGRRVPQDIGIISMDDSPYYKIAPVEMASLRRPVPQIAAQAVQMMQDRLVAGNALLAPRTVTLPAEFIPRKSCDTEMENGKR